MQAVPLWENCVGQGIRLLNPYQRGRKLRTWNASHTDVFVLRQAICVLQEEIIAEQSC